MNAVAVVAFDCDGVLFNTDRANRAYYNAMLTHLGKPMLTDEQFAFVHMHTVTESLHRLFPDEAEFDAAQRFRQKMDYHPFIRKMEMEPGLLPLLTRIKPRYQTAIATNRTDTMDAVMQAHGLTAYFDLVVSARDVLHPKPHPEPLQKILNHFQAAPDRVVYVGDSAVDAQAARGAGVVFIAFNNPALPADDHIHRLEDLETLLDARFETPADGEH